MYSVLFSFLLLFFSDSAPVAEKEVLTFDLTVKVEGLREDRGRILIALFNDKDSFLDESKSYSFQRVEAKLPHIEYTFKSVPEGTYAISVFHDVNMDEQLNFHFLGIPKEPFGFSNNPKLISGPPRFRNTSFELSESKEVLIKLKKI